MINKLQRSGGFEEVEPDARQGFFWLEIPSKSVEIRVVE